jgi:uncharacterized protein (TIGR02453 family)
MPPAQLLAGFETGAPASELLPNGAESTGPSSGAPSAELSPERPATENEVHLGLGVVAFLEDLHEHNQRAWMQANADRHLAMVVRPLQRLLQRTVASLGDCLPGFCSSTNDAALLRLQRDARFVGSGSPFWTRTGLQLRHRASVPGAPAPSLTLHLEPGQSHVSVGLPRAAAGSMSALRAAMVTRPGLWEMVALRIDQAGALWMGSPERRLTRLEAGHTSLAPHLGRRCQAALWPLTDHQVAHEDLLPRLLRAVRVGLPLLRYQCLALGLDPGSGDLTRLLYRAEARVLGEASLPIVRTRRR